MTFATHTDGCSQCTRTRALGFGRKRFQTQVLDRIGRQSAKPLVAPVWPIRVAKRHPIRGITGEDQGMNVVLHRVAVVHLEPRGCPTQPAAFAGASGTCGSGGVGIGRGRPRNRHAADPGPVAFALIPHVAVPTKDRHDWQTVGQGALDGG
jgi:hypothetical protein